MTELLTNGGFESWAEGKPTAWEIIGTQTIAKETVDVAGGTAALKGTTTGPGCGVKQTVAGISAGQRLRLQVKQHVDAAAVAAGYRVCAELQLVGGTLGGRFFNFSTCQWEIETPTNEKNLQLLTRPISTRYVGIAYELSAPAEATSIRVILKRVDGNPYSFWFDEASLQTVAAPTVPSKIDWGIYAHHIPDVPSELRSFVSGYGLPDYVGMYREWNGTILSSSDISTLDSLHITPTISWEPVEATQKPTPAEIASGSQDSYIDSQAKIIAAYGKPVLIRLYWEMNISTLLGAPMDPDTYRTAWQRVVTRFRSAGATNAKWFWCPSIDYDRGEGTKFETTHDFFPYFPGDAYVDYVGADGYSTAFYNTELKKAGFANLREIFTYTYGCLAGLSEKPFMVGETGAEEESGGNKPAWFYDLVGTVPYAFPRMSAVFYFNRHNAGEPEWEINSSPASAAAFKSVVNGPVYTNSSSSVVGSSLTRRWPHVRS